MQSKLRHEQNPYFPPRLRRLAAGEATKFRNAPLATWLETVALVLILIGVALSLAAWEQHKKQNKAVPSQVTELIHNFPGGTQKPLVPSVVLGGIPDCEGYA